MGNSSSSQKMSAQDKAILDMKNQRDKLHQYQKRVTVLTTRETQIAKECLAAGKKPQALLALRRKKYQEGLLAKADAQLEQLQKLILDVDFAQMQAGVLEGLRQGTEVLKKIHEEMGGVERVERLLNESAEARAYEREVTEMLGGQLSVDEEEEVEEELERIRRAELGEEDGAIDDELERMRMKDRDKVVGGLPGVPDTEPIGSRREPVKERRVATARQPTLA